MHEFFMVAAGATPVNHQPCTTSDCRLPTVRDSFLALHLGRNRRQASTPSGSAAASGDARRRHPGSIIIRIGDVIFKAVGTGRPYPDHGYDTPKAWSQVAPRVVHLDELVTTKSTLDLRTLLADDSTFYGDLFAHVVSYQAVLYLEEGLHRALRAALAGRNVLHARVLEL